MSSRRSGHGLSARIVRATLIIGSLTVVASGAAALVSTSRLAYDRSASHDLTVLQQVDDTIESTLRLCAVSVEGIASAASVAPDMESVAAETLSVAARDRGLISEFYLCDRDGKVILSSPQTSTVSVVDLPAYRAGLAGESGYVRGQSGDPLDLWVARAVVGPESDSLIILARVDASFVPRAVTLAAKGVPDCTLLVNEGDTVVARSGTATVPLDATWVADPRGGGAVSFMDEDGRFYRGHFNRIKGIDGIDWRIVVMEPASAALEDALMAILPPFGILAVGGLIGLATAWAVSTRLVSPLRELERTARNAASGSYVKPLPSGGDDEISRVAEAFNAVALRLNALNDLSQLMASASRLDQVLDGILLAMAHIVGPGSSAIYLCDRRNGELTPARTRGEELSGARAVPLDVDGWLTTSLTTSDPVERIGSADEIAAQLPGVSGDHRAVLCAPLIAGHEALGVVVLLREGAADTSEAEIEMVRTFSAQAAVAVQTSRLFQEESESRQVSEALRAVAEHLAQSAPLEERVRAVEETVERVFDAAFVRIHIDDPEALGLAPETYGPTTALAAVAQAMAGPGGAPVVISALSGRTDVVRAMREVDAKEALAVPVARDTDHGGWLIVGFESLGDACRAAAVAQAFGDEVGLALDNQFFYERAVSRAVNLENVLRISQTVSSSLQINVVLNRVLDVVQKILFADAAVLWVYDPKRRSLGTAMARGSAPRMVIGPDLTLGEDLPGQVFSSREPMALRRLTEEMGGLAGAAAQGGMRSLAAVPLLARGRAVGVLMVLSAREGDFSEEQLDVLQVFGSQAALAMDTARMYGKEHEVATVLQQSVLPAALLELPEVEAGSVYAPAGTDVEIGGDYYDLFRSDDGAIWFAIADVCGKGVHAATKTSMIKYSIRALVSAHQDPASILGEVNRMVTDAGDPSDIVTAWIGRYEAKSGILEWADGGHPPALLVRQDGSCMRLGPTGPLLGAIRDYEYGLERIEFGSGDRVILYTDGVTEARSGNSFFGEERVLGFVQGTGTARDLARGLLDAVRAFVQGELRDDVAILVVKARTSRETEQEDRQEKAGA